MWFSKKGADKSPDKAPTGQVTTKAVGDAAESIALAHLQKAGLVLLETNYRTPGRGGGEIDLIMKDADGTLVFIEPAISGTTPDRSRMLPSGPIMPGFSAPSEP